VADTAITGQLLSGFYGVEQNSWRWVAPRFSVALKPPSRKPGSGARLTVHFYLPDLVITREGDVTLTAAIDGKILGQQTFRNPGSYDFIADLSAEDVDTNILPVRFCFDKSMSPGADDARDLAAVINGISLTPSPKQ
jgi:hypothetical protein